MISLIEVICPHCGARGQIMLPPMGSIVIGPCPQCQGMVVVFCGRVLPLDKEIMAYAEDDKKREHLMAVLTEFLQEKLSHFVFEAEPEDAPDEQEQEDDGAAAAEHAGASKEAFSRPPEAGEAASAQGHKTAITEKELEHFVTVDLKLLDNKNYFRAVFG